MKNQNDRFSADFRRLMSDTTQDGGETNQFEDDARAIDANAIPALCYTLMFDSIPQ